MLALKRFGRSMFDVRKGEYAKTGFMSLYLMLVLFAYYILKPVSRAMFLNKLDIDKLPWLYILIAGVGGVLAYFYTKLAVGSSLRRAVLFANIFCVAVLVLFWWLVQLKAVWVLYAFNIWVSLFSIILVSQGWLVAANVFTSREAKRLYGILGVGSVIGAAFGGQFTAVMVYYIGTNNLILASAGMVILSYLAYLVAIRSSGRDLGGARAAEDNAEFSFREVAGAIRRVRHLQVIIGIMVITFMVDVMVEYQFSAFAKHAYQGRDLTAFLGSFYGLWLNLVTFVLQLFLTSFVVSRFGVGGTLQIMPVSIALASVGTLLAPGLLSTAAARLTEASTRYSFNKTGMELLYLPLPLELRNRTKAFVDVFVDRFSRGLGGMVLVFFNGVTEMDPQHFAYVVLGLAILWILLSMVAKREYVATVRKRLELRRLDFDSSRIPVSDRGTIVLLERTARGDNARQAAYALGLLSQAPKYDVLPLLGELAASPHPELRAKVFEIARGLGNDSVAQRALAEIRSSRAADPSGATREAVLYALAVSDEPVSLAQRLLEHSNPEVPVSAIDALRLKPEAAAHLLTRDWLEEMAASKDARPRRLAARAVAVRGDAGTEVIYRLLRDEDAEVRAEAIRTAGILQNREYMMPILNALPDPHLRGPAIDALAAFGPRISGALGDVLEDPEVPSNVRRHIPRVLQRITDQRSVDILLRALPNKNPAIRGAALKALNKLRDAVPDLNYGSKNLVDQVLDEAKLYFELHAAIVPFRKYESPPSATGLLVRTLEDRLQGTLERLFRLLGLRYPPRQIYAAYRAIERRSGEDFSAALDFLDNVLERDLKRVMLALLDEDAVLAQHGEELFRVKERDLSGALQWLIRSGDMWLASCAMAAAAELRIQELARDIREVGASAEAEIAEVARAAEAVLA